MKKKILIIGGSGFIGYHLAKKCLQLGWKVTSISTRKPKNIRKLKQIKYLLCDISKKTLLKKKLKKNYDFVVNLGGHVDHNNKKKTFNSHYLGLRNLADFFLSKKIKAFVQIGSGGEYGKIRSPHYENKKVSQFSNSNYYRAKILSSKYLKDLYLKKNFPVTILRLYQVYGPKQDKNRFLPIIIENCILNKSFPCSSGLQFRDFLYIDDVVNAIIKTILINKARGEIINIGLGKALNIKRIITFIRNYIKQGEPLYGHIKLRPDENLITFPDIKKAKKILNWNPNISFRLGLKKTIKYYLNQSKYN